jgi:hypothetical protein
MRGLVSYLLKLESLGIFNCIPVIIPDIMLQQIPAKPKSSTSELHKKTNYIRLIVHNKDLSSQQVQEMKQNVTPKLILPA